MDIIWLGNACFRLRSDDMVVVTDPFPGTMTARRDALPATVVTVSSHDPNHSAWQSVNGNPRVFNSPGEYEYQGIAVRGIMTPLPPDTPQERRSIAFAIEIGGVTICHLGNVKVPLVPAQTDELSPMDVLIVPVGLEGSMGVDQIRQTMQDLSPKIVIPMGLSHPTGGSADSPDAAGDGEGRPESGDTATQTGPMESFVRRMGLDSVDPQTRLVVTPANLPDDMRVVVLSPQARRT